MMIIHTYTLENHPSAQCHVNVYEDRTIQLVSYNTPVVEISPNGYVHALPMFNCSASTRRQVGWFLQEYTMIDYMSLKKVALDGMAIHSRDYDVIPD